MGDEGGGYGRGADERGKLREGERTFERTVCY